VYSSPTRIPLGLALSLLLACSAGPTDAPPPPTGPTFSVTYLPQADGQSGTAGYPLPIPLQIEVRMDGVPVEGLAVAWSSTSGTVGPWRSHTDAQGRVIATWRLGTEPGEVRAMAIVAGAEASPVTFRATAWEEVSASLVAETNIQTGVVDRPLPRDLEVLVTKGGVPRPGVPVLWSTPNGRITDSTITGANGVATAGWTLPIRPGSASATAEVRGYPGAALRFVANVGPGPVNTVTKLSGDGQTSPIFENVFESLRVRAIDALGNAVGNAVIQWTVLHGSVTMAASTTTTGPDGVARNDVQLGSSADSILVRAKHPEGASVTFSLGIDPPVFMVFLVTTYPTRFASGWNGSSPAVDTIAVGQTMTWGLLPFDYENHGVWPVGTPTFVGGDFPYGSPSEVRRTFTVPGTYLYYDPYTGVTGTLVVQ
jgi:hypothetical protein